MELTIERLLWPYLLRCAGLSSSPLSSLPCDGVSSWLLWSSCSSVLLVLLFVIVFLPLTVRCTNERNRISGRHTCTGTSATAFRNCRNSSSIHYRKPLSLLSKTSNHRLRPPIPNSACQYPHPCVEICSRSQFCRVDRDKFYMLTVPRVCNPDQPVGRLDDCRVSVTSGTRPVLNRQDFLPLYTVGRDCDAKRATEAFYRLPGNYPGVVVNEQLPPIGKSHRVDPRVRIGKPG